MRLPYNRDELATGIVHLGVGAFHRAHQAVYTEQVVRRFGGDWGICGVSLRRPDVRDALAANDNLYTVAIKSTDTVELQAIGVLRELLVAPENPTLVIERIAATGTKVVTLTITEKGYCLNPATGALDPEHTDIVHDLSHPDQPRSAIGFLVAGLAARRGDGSGGLTILSCDNLSNNGGKLRNATLEFASSIDSDLCEWIDQYCCFPSSMVDRIVPAITDTHIDAAAQQLGFRDEALVVTEPFRQWVVENNFAGPVPAWDEVGAEFVKDVEPFELMKLRLLNASHSTLAYLGCLAGYESVADVMGDTAFVSLVEQLMEEMACTLPDLDGFDVDGYRRQLLQRFANRGLEHQTRQIAMDGSQKIPQRLLPAIAERLSRGEAPDASILGLAAWIRYTMGVDEEGLRWEVSDPLAETFSSLMQSTAAEPDAYLEAVLGIESVFPPALAKNAVMRQQLKDNLDSLIATGACSTVGRHAGVVNRHSIIEESA